MTRIEEFEKRLDELFKEFTDVASEELADSLEYYYGSLRRKQE